VVLGAAPILVTGGTGQLATALLAARGHRPMLRAGRPDFDFDRLDSISACLRAAAPSLIINAAAYTAVDRAESEPDAARRANTDGPRRIAEYCAATNTPLIHISTDYVFDGEKRAPYRETDPTNPTTIYGTTKRDGEDAILATGAPAIILRTAWVYAATGRNFVLTMLNAAKKTTELRVVADQTGCPTAAHDLAAVIIRIADRIATAGWSTHWRGLYHAAGSGATTWHGLATATFAEAAQYGITPPTIIPIATADWPTPARRPTDSRLDCSKLGQTFGIALPDWRNALSQTLKNVYLAK
jgi:dTDP-4-dehydrorhamnose reductase